MVSPLLPAIIRGMGYSNVNAQLLTVPVYVVGAISILTMAKFGDKFKMRSPFIIGSFTLQLIGYVILITVPSVGGRYTACFIVALGLYGVAGINIPCWSSFIPLAVSCEGALIGAGISNNCAGHYKRSTAIGINQLFGNSAGAA